MFLNEIIKNVVAVQWGRSQEDIPATMHALPVVILVCFCCFKIFCICREGTLVPSEIRNVLGNEKAVKVGFVFKN